MPLRFWLPLLITAATLLLAPWVGGRQPPLQSHALALLLCLTLTLSGVLFAVILKPERFG